MRSPIHRLISVAILLGWLAPSVGALGIGMHVASEHHGLHGSEHREEIVDLVRVATHGHHHDLGTAPDHHHEARLDAQAAACRSDLSLLAVLPASPLLSAAGAERSNLDQPQRRGPPTPLFTANCSLLL